MFSIDGSYYYFNEDGVMQTGFQTIDNKTYFFSRVNGVRRTGMFSINNYMYYFDEDGVMQTGTFTIDGLEYKFDVSGKLIGGWQFKDGKTYFLKSDGSYIKGWAIVEGEKCYFNDLGVLIVKGAYKVIDVSKWNGAIAWEELKNKSDVDGVIVRLGYGSFEFQEDQFLATNIQALKKLGIPYGVYLYSYADSVYKAETEAELTKKLINKYNIEPTLGIYWDLEERSKADILGKPGMEEAIKTYISSVSTLGYDVKIYASTNFINDYFTDYAKQYVGWVAQYNNYCTYKGSYDMWQYTSKGSVIGINGNVDLSVRFRK